MCKGTSQQKNKGYKKIGQRKKRCPIPIPYIE